MAGHKNNWNAKNKTKQNKCYLYRLEYRIMKNVLIVYFYVGFCFHKKSKCEIIMWNVLEFGGSNRSILDENLIKLNLQNELANNLSRFTMKLPR